MNMRNTQEVQNQVEKLFPNLSGEAIWFLVKMAKHVRLRCRNNAAFNNWMNATFGKQFRFNTVTKKRKNRATGFEESYPGLQITDAKTGESVSSVAGEDEAEE
jgi:hypothetical protein